MNEKPRAQNQQHHHGGISVPDVYHVLFRHKWSILLLAIAGFAAAGIIYYTAPTDYVSEAELLIKFVREFGAPNVNTADGQMRAVDAGGEGIISTEIGILESYDLALHVATNFGPERILGKTAKSSDSPTQMGISAANIVRDGLRVDRYGKGPMLSITFAHPDINLVQGILTEIIADYQDYTIKIHGAAGANYESNLRETADLRNEWLQAEDELRKAKKEVNVMSVDDSKKFYALTIFQDSQSIKVQQAELDDRHDALALLKGTTNSASGTTTNKTEIPQDTIDQYNDTVDLASSLKKAYDKMRDDGLPPHNKLVIEKKEQWDKAKEAKKKMETDEPRLTKLNLSGKTTSGQAANETLAEQISDQETEIAKLEKKIKFLQADYNDNFIASSNLDLAESRIIDLEFKEHQKKENYETFMSKLASSKIDLDLAALKNVNISVTQQPMPPALERTKTPKKMAIAVLTGILSGLAWAFLCEYYLDHSVKRAKEVEGDLGMRLFLSIPKVKRNISRRKQLAAPKDATPTPDGEEGPLVPAVNGAVNGSGKLDLAPWDPNNSLYEYYEALRDRLIAYFDVNNLTHKPKLVAVTGASKGSGATSIAVGLAASLSQTGDGKVLLIDMNYENGGAQSFYQGKPGCELDAALTDSTRETALVQDNLYVVSGPANGDKLARMLPKKFATLVPKFEASKYDYIIFDMPPISRTGVTQRLAGFMDMMLVVVEAEKTSREVVRQANALLNESKAKVSVVFNKTRTYVPARLHQEF